MNNSKKKIKEKDVEPEIEAVFNSLRARTWPQFIGQEGIKESLQIAISAAKKRKEAVEHILFYGPPGLGKTTLSHLVAKEMDANIRVTSGPAIERTGDLASILTNLEKGDILFIDEIHRLHKSVEETLYPAMEDYALDIVLGKGPSARTMRLDLPQFTIIGATTRAGMLSAPLRDRFGVIHRLNYYLPDELCVIVQNAATKLGVLIDGESIKEIAQRGRGTPRIALKLLKRARDYASVKGKGNIEKKLVAQALSLLEVDSVGLDDVDRKMLLAIIEKHSGGPVGIETIASTMSEDVGTIEEVIEPYLMQLGFISRTPRGRVATSAAYAHLGKIFKEDKQQKLI